MYTPPAWSPGHGNLHIQALATSEPGGKGLVPLGEFWKSRDQGRMLIGSSLDEIARSLVDGCRYAASISTSKAVKARLAEQINPYPEFG